MTNRRERTKDLTVIAVDYYMYDPVADEEYKELNYLCIKDNGIYYFDDCIIDNTMVFENQLDAMTYIKDHNLNKSICYENIRVLSLIKEIQRG